MMDLEQMTLSYQFFVHSLLLLSYLFLSVQHVLLYSVERGQVHLEPSGNCETEKSEQGLYFSCSQEIVNIFYLDSNPLPLFQTSPGSPTKRSAHLFFDRASEANQIFFVTLD
jgi:hypothetical protein